MEDVIKVGLGFIVLAVMFAIGGAIVVQTNTTSTSIAGSTGLMGNITNGTGLSLQTFVNFLPVLAIAAVGGVALAYILGFLGGVARQ